MRGGAPGHLRGLHAAGEASLLMIMVSVHSAEHNVTSTCGYIVCGLRPCEMTTFHRQVQLQPSLLVLHTDTPSAPHRKPPS